MKSPRALLIEFYSAYLDWVEEGQPFENKHGFLKTDGLCWLLKYYMWSAYPNQSTYEVSDFQKYEFSNAGLDSCFPFDDDDHFFYKEQREGTLHENPRRLEWVRKYLLP